MCVRCVKRMTHERELCLSLGQMPHFLISEGYLMQIKALFSQMSEAAR